MSKARVCLGLSFGQSTFNYWIKLAPAFKNR